MNKKNKIRILIVLLVILGLIAPVAVNSQELESVYELKNSIGKTTLSIKMKGGQISITARSKAAGSNVSIRWESIGYSITRLPITSTITTKGYYGPGPLDDIASSGIATIYFEDATKTWYEEGEEVITTVTFSEEQIKNALQDDFSDLKKGTTIYLHGIFRSFNSNIINGVETKTTRKGNIKNWKDIMNAEYWASGTLSGFSKYFNMPIKFMPNLQKNSIYYVTQDGSFIAPRRHLSSKYIDENVSWLNEPASINYYDSKYNVKGYYVTKKLDNTKTWVDEGFLNKGKNISQIISGKTKVFLGGMEIYLVYEKETKGPEPPGSETPSPGQEPIQERIISNIQLPILSGMIKADPKNLENFEVTEGIPTTESLYTNVDASPYLLGYHFEKKVGTKTYPVKVKKEYILSWTGQDDSGEIVLTQRQTIDQVVNISRPFGYWQIVNLDLYAVNKATINNYALPGEKTIIDSNDKDLNIPSINISHSSLEKDHIIIPSEITNGITLKTQLIYGDDTKPKIPQENFQLVADQLIPKLKVKNDSLIIGGQTILNNNISETEGLQVDITNLTKIIDQGKKQNKGSSLIKENLVINGTKENGVFHSSGTAEYKRIVSQYSKYNDKIEYSIPNINSVIIHTPVVCHAMYSSDNDKYVQLEEISPGLNLVIDDEKYTNDFTLQISNNGFHSNKRGYVKRDYSYSLRDKNISYIATREGQMRNEVKFPFDIYKYDKMGVRSLVNKDTWIILGTESHEFSLPLWVGEGSYTASCRSIAVNADASKLDLISEHGANTKLFNYVATNNFDIEVSGRVYGLAIYDITDYPIWQEVFRVHYSLGLKTNEPDIYQDGVKEEGYQKNYRYDYTVGTRDQNGIETGRLEKYTIPLVDGSHPLYFNQGILKTGYGVRFKLTTAGNMFSEGSSIVIKPRFYYVDKAGKYRKEVDLYYEEVIGTENRKLVKVGDALDSTNIKFQEVGSPYLAIGNKELENTAKIMQKNYEDIIGRREGLFNFGHIQISSAFRTFPKVESKHIQNWYGYYYLPSKLYVAPKDYDVYDCARKQGVNFQEDFWLDDGYLIINMDIATIGNDGKERLRYTNGEDSIIDNNMWKMEGFNGKKTSNNGVEFDFKEGDFLVYRINSSVLEDYTFDGL